jgi:hypothetical protein
MNKLFYSSITIILFFLVSCKEKKKQEPFFPVLSFIKSQVAHIDTSVYPITEIVQTDSTKPDTIFVKREDFRKEAHDFLDLPDLTQNKYADEYTEEKIYDQELNQVIIKYAPQNEQLELRRQEVIIKPSDEGDKVRMIFFDTFSSDKDSTVQKRLLWKVDESFQVVTIIEKPGQPDKTITKTVTWNQNNN